MAGLGLLSHFCRVDLNEVWSNATWCFLTMLSKIILVSMSLQISYIFIYDVCSDIDTEMIFDNGVFMKTLRTCLWVAKTALGVLHVPLWETKFFCGFLASPEPLGMRGNGDERGWKGDGCVSQRSNFVLSHSSKSLYARLLRWKIDALGTTLLHCIPRIHVVEGDFKGEYSQRALKKSKWKSRILQFLRFFASHVVEIVF